MWCASFLVVREHIRRKTETVAAKVSKHDKSMFAVGEPIYVYIRKQEGREGVCRKKDGRLDHTMALTDNFETGKRQ